ncbi:MAG: hypothetical protein ABSG60_07725 [Terracidiphilus sp.]|jgi:hypothetical protein
MSFKNQFDEEPELRPIDKDLWLHPRKQRPLPGDPESLEAPELAQALKNFRASVLAWSEAAYSRPRTAVKTVRQRSWRLAAGWALGCALVAGGVSGGIYERHHRQELARMAAARAAESERLVAEQRASQEEEDLLAKVDSDVSREVPSAMEPLAQLMTEDEAK